MPLILMCDICRDAYRASDLSMVTIDPPHYQDLPEPSAENYVDIRDEERPDDRVIRLHYCELCLDELELPPVKPESDPDLAPDPYHLGDDVRTDGGLDVPVCETDGCETPCPGLDDGWEQTDGTLRCADCWDEWEATGQWPDEGGDL